MQLFKWRKTYCKDVNQSQNILLRFNIKATKFIICCNIPTAFMYVIVYAHNHVSVSLFTEFSIFMMNRNQGIMQIGSILTIGNENKRYGGLNENGPHRFIY